MLNARHSFAFLWQRLVAALSLLMAASLAPAAVSAPAGGAGAGAIGSRAGSGTAVTSAAGALAGKVAAIVEGGRQQAPLDSPSDDATKSSACTLAAWPQVVPPSFDATGRPPAAEAPPQTHAARSGHARAPPLA